MKPQVDYNNNLLKESKLKDKPRRRGSSRTKQKFKEDDSLLQSREDQKEHKENHNKSNHGKELRHRYLLSVWRWMSRLWRHWVLQKHYVLRMRRSL